MHTMDAYREQKQHGSALFPFNIYPCTIPGDFPYVPLHWQAGMELVYIKKGIGLCRVGDKELDARAGDVFLIPPGQLHGLRGVPGRVMEYENFLFDVGFLGAGAADLCAQQYLVPLAAGQLSLPGRLTPGDTVYDSVAACLTEAETLCGQRGPGYMLGVKAAMLRLLFLLVQAGLVTATAPETPDAQRLKTILQLVEANYAQPLPVGQAAAACGCSQSHFMRWFKKVTGSSFASYLNERRLAAAAQALRETNDTVLAIAEGCGFYNLSNFNRQFRARYGMTPGAWRRAR